MSTFITKFKALLDSKWRVVARIVKYGILLAVACFAFAYNYGTLVDFEMNQIPISLYTYSYAVNETVGSICIGVAAVLGIAVCVFGLTNKRYALSPEEKGSKAVQIIRTAIVVFFAVWGIFNRSFPAGVERKIWTYYYFWLTVYLGMLFKSVKINRLSKKKKSIALAVCLTALCVTLVLNYTGIAYSGKLYSYHDNVSDEYARALTKYTVFLFANTTLFTFSIFTTAVFANSLINFDKKEEITAAEAE